MIIDCDTCRARGPACGECLVTAFLSAPPAVEFDDHERRALDALAAGGLVPRLRLIPPEAAAG